MREQNNRREEVKALLDGFKNRKTAAASAVSAHESFVDSGARFEDGDELRALKEAVCALENKPNGKPQKVRRKAVKTLLHLILEAVDARGKVGIRELAQEFCVDENIVSEWSSVMAQRGMVRLSYPIRGGAVVEKIRSPIPSN